MAAACPARVLAGLRVALAAGCCLLLCSALLNVYFLTKPSGSGPGLQKRDFVYPIKDLLDTESAADTVVSLVTHVGTHQTTGSTDKGLK